MHPDAPSTLPGLPMTPSPWFPVPRVSRRDDAIALITLTLIILATVVFRFKYDNWLSGFDMFPFFLPNYGYVGDRIRDFEVPAWNPHFFSGTPMAGDASGGWMC